MEISRTTLLARRKQEFMPASCAVWRLWRWQQCQPAYHAKSFIQKNRVGKHLYGLEHGYSAESRGHGEPILRAWQTTEYVSGV
eukprot:610209-Pleurochrysis_carterae.AAC.1